MNLNNLGIERFNADHKAQHSSLYWLQTVRCSERDSDSMCDPFLEFFNI